MSDPFAKFELMIKLINNAKISHQNRIKELEKFKSFIFHGKDDPESERKLQNIIEWCRSINGGFIYFIKEMQTIHDIIQLEQNKIRNENKKFVLLYVFCIFFLTFVKKNYHRLQEKVNADTLSKQKLMNENQKLVQQNQKLTERADRCHKLWQDAHKKNNKYCYAISPENNESSLKRTLSLNGTANDAKKRKLNNH